MKVLIATEKPFAPAAVKGITKELEEAGHEVKLLEKYTDKAQLKAAVADANAMIVRSDKITPEIIDAAQQLKIVVRAKEQDMILSTPTMPNRKMWWLRTLPDKTQMPWPNSSSDFSFTPCVTSSTEKVYGTKGQEARHIGFRQRGPQCGTHSKRL